MSDIILGDRVKFTAKFRQGADPYVGTAVVKVYQNNKAVRAQLKNGESKGDFYVEVVAEEVGELRVVFMAPTGEKREITWNVVPAEAPPVFRDLGQSPSPPPRVTPREAPDLSHFDRASARSRLMAAGFPVEGWSDAKMKGALEGLDESERGRRVFKR